MKRIVGMAEIDGDTLHLAVFEIAGSKISLVTEETLGLNETSSYVGLEVWLIVRTRDRSVRYVTLPGSARRQAREMAMLQASPSLLLPPEEYAYDVLLKPVGDKLGALVIVIPLEKAHAWEERISRAGLVLVSFAIEPLFYPLLRPPQEGAVMFCMPTPQGSLAIVGCENGTPVCWTTVQDESQIPSGDIENMLVQEYFCESPRPFVPRKLLAAETSLEPRLVGYLAGAHLASLSPRPWEGRSILAFAEFLQREQYAPATRMAIAKCAAIWCVVALLAALAGIAHVHKVEAKAEAIARQSEQARAFAEQSTQAAQEVGRLMELRYGLEDLTLNKRLSLDVLRAFQQALPLRVKLVSLRYDAASGMQAECVAERESDILLLLNKLGRLPLVKDLRLLFAETREDNTFHFRIEIDLPDSGAEPTPPDASAGLLPDGEEDA